MTCSWCAMVTLTSLCEDHGKAVHTFAAVLTWEKRGDSSPGALSPVRLRPALAQTERVRPGSGLEAETGKAGHAPASLPRGSLATGSLFFSVLLRRGLLVREVEVSSRGPLRPRVAGQRSRGRGPVRAVLGCGRGRSSACRSRC